MAVVSPDPTLGSLRIGVSSWGDPSDPALLSGVPAAILAALQALVGGVVSLTQSPEPRTAGVAWRAGALAAIRPGDLRKVNAARRRLWRVGQASPPMHIAAGRALRRHIAHAGRLDGLVQYGGELRAPPGLAMVTFQDSTLAQAVAAYEWPHLRDLSARQIARNIDWQRAAYASAVACCGASHWTVESLRRDYGVPQPRAHVLGFGANYVPDSTAERDWTVPRFLIVASDWERKNGAAVVAAFRRVRERFPLAVLDVVGDHPRLDEAGVTAHGRLRLSDAGDRGKLRALYAHATVMVMPSLHEPLGIAHIDAGLHGMASIGSANGGAATAIGDAGRVVDPNDDDALAAAMLELSAGALARRLGERARQRALLFTWPQVAERLIRALAIPGLDVSGLAEFL